jgi:hypothetical protein
MCPVQYSKSKSRYLFVPGAADVANTPVVASTIANGHRTAAHPVVKEKVQEMLGVRTIMFAVIWASDTSRGVNSRTSDSG